MADKDIISRLFELGWLSAKTVEEALEIAQSDPDRIKKAKELYAGFHGLSCMDDVDAHLLQEPGTGANPRICGLPDTMPFGTSVCKWPDPNITWSIGAQIAGLTQDQVIGGITEALARWAKVCGIRPQYQPGNSGARIIVGSRGIDGAMGVLAESELPCGRVAQCRQWYDNGEPWALFDGPGLGGRQIDFIRVAAHELGHALGMNHIGAGNLLAPTYSPNVWTPQAGDIAEMQARYGPPITSPPVPPTGGGEEIVIRVKGSVAIDGKRITDLLLQPCPSDGTVPVEGSTAEGR